MPLNTISTSSIVDGQIVYAEHILRVIGALNGSASNSIFINGDVKQGNVSLNTTDGSTSHAEGYRTNAGGQYSHAEGYQVSASGQYSHAEGNGTSASNLYTHAEGASTAASGLGAHAEGFSALASGDYSHAEGYQTYATAISSHAEGLGNIASGDYSHAEGTYNYATGDGSHAEGAGNVASGDYSHAEGNNSQAPGIYSHAEGRYSYAGGGSSHAEGYRTSASGIYSHAEGYYAEAIGTGSHAGGLYTIAYDNYQTVVGQYNKDLNTDDYFVVGVGTSTGNRKDGLGVNNTRTYISNSVYLPNLTNVSKTNVITLDTDGRLFYQTTSSLRVDTASFALTATSASYTSFALTASYVLGGGGGSGSTTPGGPNDSIQFNKNGAFTGSSFLTYSESISGNYLKYTGSLNINGSIDMNGSIFSTYFTNMSSNINQLTASYAMTASYVPGVYDTVLVGTSSFGSKRYYSAPTVISSTGFTNYINAPVTNDLLFAVPLEIKNPKILDEIRISAVNDNGPGFEATGSIRLGLYRDNGNIAPGALLYDSGQFNVSASNVGGPPLVFSGSNLNISVPPGILWIAYIGSGSNGASNPLQITSMFYAVAGGASYGGNINLGTSISTLVTSVFPVVSSSVSSSLPNPFPLASASIDGYDVYNYGVPTPLVYFSA